LSDAGQRCDLLFRALAPALPDRVVAAATDTARFRQTTCQESSGRRAHGIVGAVR
jgi:hypothetical protein